MAVEMIVEKCFADAPLPVRKNKDDSGADVVFHNVKRIYKHTGGNSEVMIDDPERIKKHMNGDTLELQYLERALLGTGIKATVGDGYEIQVRPRSGLALNKGLSITNSPGTVDRGYKNEISVILENRSRKIQSVTIGDRIAQLVVSPVVICDIKEGQLDNNDRGGGFGSTDE